MEKATTQSEFVQVLENKCLFMTSFLITDKNPLIGETYNVGPGKTAIPKKLYDHMIKMQWVKDKIEAGLYAFKKYEAKEMPCVKGVEPDAIKAAELSKLCADELYDVIAPSDEENGVFDVFVLRELVKFEKRSDVSTWAKQKLELINK